MAEMKIGGETFNVEVEGPENAPVLMISNSLGSNLHMWDDQIPALSKHFRVVRYDSRGHGLSAAPAGPYSLEQLGKDALSILDTLGVKKAHWMGLSKGGAVGQWLLLNAPDRIERAVLANTAAQFGTADTWNDRLRTLRELGLQGMVDAVIDRWFTKEFQAKAPEAIARIKAAFEKTPADGYAACMAALRDIDLRDAIRNIRNQVLVIIGKNDPATPPEAGKAIAAAIPGARLVELDAAHLSNIEAADEFNKAVIDFLTAPAKPARPKSFPSRKQATKKPVKKAAKARPAARAAKKATKKAVKKATKKAAKKSVKKVAKAAKKAVKKAAKKAAAKKPTKKTSAKTPKKQAQKASKAARKTSAKAARKPAGKQARKAVKRGRR
ncbi:MAG: 3-oxoadipate enol-lactonase [Rhodoblastus sp.]|nr:3-oxoadipate enol-lactonase [Rhodoblastus sp.]